MPNYKSKMLTFLSIGEMTRLLLDNTDEDGILFAVATDATNFKIVMWRKTSTATVDNETVYPANGPGRWHVLPSGGTIGDLSDVSITTPTVGQTLSYNGSNWINSVASGSGGNPVEYILDWNLPASLPATPVTGKSIYYLEQAGNSGVSRSSTYLYANSSWKCVSAKAIHISSIQEVGINYFLSVLWLDSSSYSLGNVVFLSNMEAALGLSFNCYEPPATGYFSSISGFFIYVYRDLDNAYIRINPDISGQNLLIDTYWNESYFKFLFVSDCSGANTWRRIA